MEDLLGVSQLLNEIQTISESFKRVADATGENFNIFSILKVESDEVATHSRFIGELLDRKGRHRQKDKFLRLFINRFVQDHSFIPEKSKVTIEYYIGKVEKEKGGRIDILIKDDENNVIMIENKIYAIEQKNQLLRYKNAFPHGKLFYLTLFGDESSQKSAVGIYDRLSYEFDVIEWLEDCKKEAVNVPILRETISQYIYLLKKLTHQNLNKKMNQDIITRILKDKNSLSAYKTLFDLHKDLKKVIIFEIVEKIKELFERKGFINIETINFSKDKGLLISFQTENLAKRNLNFRLNFEGNNYSALIIGFFNSSNKQAKDSKLLEMVKEEFPKAKQSDWWNVYMFYEDYQDWYFANLNKIYLDTDGDFYIDLESKIDRLLNILDSRINECSE